MAIVHIPSAMRELTRGERAVEVEGATVAELIDRLDGRFPGLKARLVEEGRLRPGVVVFVDGVSRRPALRAGVSEASEVHFVPAISGGAYTAAARGGGG